MPKSYATDVQPLFRAKDLACMGGQGVSLDDPAYMSDATGDATFADHANARLVYLRLTSPAVPVHPNDPSMMPPDGPWPQAKLDIYSGWMTDGFLP